jgi:membrane protease YdiL (CAAX protease family)
MAVGVILGMVYVKTGNIIISSLIHILNNSTSVALMYIYGKDAASMKTVDIFGGGSTGTIVIVSLGILGFYLVYRFWKRYDKLVDSKSE